MLQSVHRIGQALSREDANRNELVREKSGQARHAQPVEGF